MGNVPEPSRQQTTHEPVVDPHESTGLHRQHPPQTHEERKNNLRRETFFDGKMGTVTNYFEAERDTDLRRPQRHFRAAQALSSHPRRGLATPVPSPPSARQRVPPMPSELSKSSSQCTAGHATEGRSEQALHSPPTSARSRKPRAATTTFIPHDIGALAVVRRHQKAGAARVIRRVLCGGCIYRASTPSCRRRAPPRAFRETAYVPSSTCALAARAGLRVRRGRHSTVAAAGTANSTGNRAERAPLVAQGGQMERRCAAVAEPR